MIKKWSVSYPAVNGTEQRRAYVYLPTMYEAEPDRRFPVLYMFDGQNVFFDEDATYGKSWGVADYLDYTDTPLIVAAVECNAGPNNERLVEYSPYRFDDPTYGHFDGKGQATMSWYIHRFKPFIDRSFRTLPDREHTFIGGSSMGGLMSLYALLQYNDENYDTLAIQTYGGEGLLWSSAGEAEQYTYASYLTNTANGPLLTAHRDNSDSSNLSDVLDMEGNVLLRRLGSCYNIDDLPDDCFVARQGFDYGLMDSTGQWLYRESIFSSPSAMLNNFITIYNTVKQLNEFIANNF